MSVEHIQEDPGDIMPLKIDLKPGEKFVLNGAVVTVGKDGRSLVLNNEAMLLRDRDVMQEEEATTPVRRIYFAIMLMYVDAENIEKYREHYQRYLLDLLEVTTLPDVKIALVNIAEDVAAKFYYRALKTCRTLMNLEAELLASAPKTASA
ncbi:MAG: flagellar biosynthesis repressor FlbT [Alphaproteobacteria bacterium]